MVEKNMKTRKHENMKKIIVLKVPFPQRLVYGEHFMNIQGAPYNHRSGGWDTLTFLLLSHLVFF